MHTCPLKITNLKIKSAVATLKTIKGWVQNCSNLLYSTCHWRPSRKIIVYFAHRKSILTISLSYICLIGYSNLDKINAHHNRDTLHYQQWSLPSTIKTSLVLVRKNNKLLVNRKEKNDIRISKGYLRYQSPHLGIQELKIK